MTIGGNGADVLRGDDGERLPERRGRPGHGLRRRRRRRRAWRWRTPTCSTAMPATDRIFGDDGDDLIDAGAGNDRRRAGPATTSSWPSQGDGNDTYFGDEGGCGARQRHARHGGDHGQLTVDLGTGSRDAAAPRAARAGPTCCGASRTSSPAPATTPITACKAVNVMDGGAATTPSASCRRPMPMATPSSASSRATRSTSRRSTPIRPTATSLHAGQRRRLQRRRAARGSPTRPATDEDYTVVEGNIEGGEPGRVQARRIKGHHDLTSDDFNL